MNRPLGNETEFFLIAEGQKDEVHKCYVWWGLFATGSSRSELALAFAGHGSLENRHVFQSHVRFSDWS